MHPETSDDLTVPSPTPGDEAYRDILRRCGLVLIVVGGIDLAWLAWCFASSRPYHSSLNIFGVIGGALLMRGNLNVARWIAMLSTFMLAASFTALVATPLLFPLGYWLAVMRNGFDGASLLILVLATTALLLWLRRELHRPALRAALAQDQLPAPKFIRPVLAGVLIPVLIIPLVGLMLRGATAREAVRRAEQQFGRGYRYVVTSLQMHSSPGETSIAASVAAYNDTELKRMQISWKE